jgi:hypothetical protein
VRAEVPRRWRSVGAASTPARVDRYVRTTARRPAARSGRTRKQVGPRLDGSYRAIQVKVRGRERYVARTRAGYRATP